jgi:hypothetical protein
MESSRLQVSAFQFIWSYWNPFNETCMTVHVTFELLVATGNDYVSITRRCYGPQ